MQSLVQSVNWAVYGEIISSCVKEKKHVIKTKESREKEKDK